MQGFHLLTAVAERQEWLVATWQAAALGITSDVLFGRVTDQGWERWHGGVVGLPGPRPWRRRILAALLAYGAPHSAAQRVQRGPTERAFVDSLTAAALGAGQLLWGPTALWVYGLQDVLTEVWIRLPQRSGHVARDGVRLRYGALPREQITFVDGLPVPIIEQAFLEYAAWCGSNKKKFSRLLDLICDADAKRLTDLDALERYLARVGPVSGKRTLLRALAELRGTMSHSRTEARGRRIVIAVARSYGLTASTSPVEIFDGDVRVGEADIGVLEITLDLEIDGPHHRMRANQVKDARRDRRVRRARWDVERFPVELVDDAPDAFRAKVDAAIRDRLHILGLEHVHKKRI